MEEKTILKVAVIAGITIVCTAMVVCGETEAAVVTIISVGILVAAIAIPLTGLRLLKILLEKL